MNHHIRRNLPMLTRLILAPLAALLLASSAGAQTVVGPAGSYTVTTPAPTRVQYHDGYVVISWGDVPPAPIPPSPKPDPVPPTPPTPTWGPLDRIVVLYESAKLDGRGPLYSQDFRDALSSLVGRDANRVPFWRVLDKDVAVTESPEWIAAVDKAKGEYGAATSPVLFALDAQGRVKSVPLDGLSDADAIAKVKELAGATK